MNTGISISEQTQWSLVEKRFHNPQGTFRQFLIDNKFPHESQLPDIGKYKSALRLKLEGIKNLSESQRIFVINEGKTSGKNLTLKKNMHLIPDSMRISVLAQPDVSTVLQTVETIVAQPVVSTVPQTLETTVAQPVVEREVRIPITRHSAFSCLEELAKMSVQEKNYVFKIMDGLPDTLLPKIIKLIVSNRT